MNQFFLMRMRESIIVFVCLTVYILKSFRFYFQGTSIK
ncbi:hypothetical protein LEP1GSC039_3791 [Leptospira santarosai str. 2000027870]|nr:hypothetical protein LEP1GSC039_3791 [Leptospira santarosai str. 2000027870]